MIQDPYQVLGVSRSASKEEIKKAYRQKAKENHPDLHPNDAGAADRMNQINEAYDMINNPEKYRSSTMGGNAYGGYRQNGYGQSGHGQNGYSQGGYYSGNGGQGYSQGGYYGRNGNNNGSAGGNGYYGQGGYYNGGNGANQRQNSWGYQEVNFEDLFGFGRTTMNFPKPERKAGDSQDVIQAVDLIQAGQYAYATQILNSIVSAYRNARWYYLSAVANYGAGNIALALERMQTALQMDPGNPEYQSTAQAMQQMGTYYRQAGGNTAGMGFGGLCMTFLAMQFCCMFCH